MKGGHAALARAVRLRPVGVHLGRIYLVLSALMGVPVLAALLLGDVNLALVTAGSAAAMAGAGGLLARQGAGDDLTASEAMVVTALVFASVPVLLAPIFMAAGLGPVDALFESVAAVTTAGLSMFDSVAGLPPAFLFTRAWMQWFGGLGFVALCAALITGPGVAARRMAMEFDRDAGFASSTRARARHVLVVYGALTAAGFVALWMASADPFLALVHALAATATGGYSSFDAGPAGFGGILPRALIVLLCVLGALSFDLHGRLHRNRLRALVADPGLRAMLACIAASTLLLVLLEGERDLAGAWRSLELAVMAQTTAGFTTVPLGSLEPASQTLLMLSMLIGGDIGSTAGGIKLLRLVILARIVQLLIARASLPRHAVVVTRVDGRRVEEPEIIAVLAFLVLLGALIAASWLAFVASGHAPFPALVEVVAAVSTAGLSAGLTGPDLAPHLKLVLALDMLAGRLEVVALVVLLHPGTWIGRRRSRT